MSSSLYGNHGTYDSLGFGFDCSAEPVQMPIVSTEEIGRKEVPSKQTTTTKTEVSNKRASESRSITPTSIKQIYTCTEMHSGELLLDGAKLWLVTVFGYIENLHSNKDFLKFTINDGSATIRATMWNDNKEKELSLSNTREHAFVKITGEILSDQEPMELLVHNVSSMADWNELSCHLFDIILVHNKKKTDFK